MSDMVYTLKISDNSPQSQSIINMLLSLSKDYDFLTVEEKEENELTHEQGAELDRRYQSFLQNPQSGRRWSKVKSSLLK